MNSIDQRYKVLLQKILDEGVRKQTRNGEVLSMFSHQIRHNMVEGFPLLTTKKMAWKSIVTELLWFLRGDLSRSNLSTSCFELVRRMGKTRS